MAATKRIPTTKFLILLGLPSLGLTFAVTTLAVYLPSILTSLTSPLVIGIIIGAEGIFGLFVPVISGAVSDRAATVSGRLESLVPAAFVMAGAMALMGLVHRLWFISGMVALFYIGYYAYLAPYWALYADIIPKSHSGRSQSGEGTWRIIGTITSLVAGGFFLGLWLPLPFEVGAGLILFVTVFLRPILNAYLQLPIHKGTTSIKGSFAAALYLLKTNPGIRNLAIANGLWNATLRSISAFVVLFFTVGLGRSHHFVAGVVFPVAAGGLAIMAPLAGKLADAYGHIKVLTIAAIIYTAGNVAVGITHQAWVISIVPFVAGAAAVVMALPYAVLMRLLKRELHGEASGVFGISRGAGAFLGPLLTGLAIMMTQSLFPSTRGYAALWWTSALYLGISIIFLRKIPMV